MTNQQPSIGRIVHFVFGGDHYAALITDPDFTTQDGHTGVALTVFPPNEPYFTTVAIYDAQRTPGTWHWPEFVPAT